MPTPTAFAALRVRQQTEFVVWTFSSLYASAIKSLHLPHTSPRGAWLGITVSLSRP
ncbi:MAG TPA: hypothetical protein VGW12_04280 [Pyrinomonadaceae bacterium]|nr:hypothetical protein [Pyrinomonadaceae bacterium]